MLISVAHELSSIIHQLGKVDDISVKIACDASCEELQGTVAKCSSDVYEVMTKEAKYYVAGEMPEHRRVTAFVTKLAEAMHSPQVSADMLHKIAAAVEADRALTETLETDLEQGARTKIAELQSFGREYFLELIREVI